MKIKTYGELRDEVELELDIKNESIISPDEMVIYTNDSLTDSESVIMKLNEDYFLKEKDITFTSGVDKYDLPEDIFAQKIRYFGYVGPDTTEVYEICPYKSSDLKPFQDMYNVQSIDTVTGWPIKYILQNTLEDGFQMVLTPPPTVTGSYGRMWYIRECAKIPLVSAGSQEASDATLLDIPQYFQYMKSFVCMKCVSKEGHPRYEQILAEFQYQRKQFQEILMNRQPDNNNLVPLDLGHYMEQI
jgi:hypothetical protein